MIKTLIICAGLLNLNALLTTKEEIEQRLFSNTYKTDLKIAREEYDRIKSQSQTANCIKTVCGVITCLAGCTTGISTIVKASASLDSNLHDILNAVGLVVSCVSGVAGIVVHNTSNKKVQAKLTQQIADFWDNYFHKEIDPNSKSIYEGVISAILSWNEETYESERTKYRNMIITNEPIHTHERS